MKKHLYHELIKGIKIIRNLNLLKTLLCILVLLTIVNLVKANNDPQNTIQVKTVTGIVTEVGGEALLGVSVLVKGTSTATMTDLNGQYSINVGSNTAVLVFSYLGKKTQEITINNRSVINVELQDDVQVLEEVVIQTGYMTQKKADLTGSLAMADSKDIEQNPSANVMKSLQGKLPGVYITSDGNPADNVGIQIRGITSMRSAAPLIVVDGQPVDINLRDINTLDIESIQVLKDAASASIYGSRAASGVILIETKKGKKGELSIKYDGYVGFSSLVNKPDMLNTLEYGKAIWQATVNDGNDPATAIRIYNYDWHRDSEGIPVLNSVSPVEWLNSQKTMPSADTDWWDEMTQTGINTSHQITVSNGGEKARSLFSLNYYNNEGTSIHSHFKRYTTRLNSDYDLIKDRLKVGENFTVSYLNFNGQSDVYNSIIMPSIVPVYTTDGGWGGTAMSLGMDDYNNPVRSVTINKDNNDNFVKLLGSAYLDLAILKNLHIKTQFGVDYSNYFYRYIDYTWEEGGGRSDTQNGVNNYQSHSFNYTWTNTLIYNLNQSKHSLDILLGQEMYHYVNDGFRSYRSGIYLENRDYAYLDATTGDIREQPGWGDEAALLSYFAKANYSFDSKYLLSATIRYDGASKFGTNNRWGTFPAFSLGWRIKNEAFLENQKWLSELKLRASWGMNGNSNIPSNALVNIYGAGYDATAYSIGGNDNGTLYSGYYKIHTGNPNLKWEATEQTNLGFDFGFLDQRLRGSFDYFYKKTDNMLYEPPYIGALGEGGYQWVNAADMENKGIELLVSYNNHWSSDFLFTVTGTLSTYRNKIKSLPENVRYTYGGNGLKDDIIGRPLNSHYGLVADGIFKTQEEVDNSPEQQGKGLGRIRYKDLDGDGRIDETYDRTWIGNPHPDFEAGINFEASYKGFDLALYFQGVFGQEVYNSWKEYSDFWNITVQNDKNHPTRILGAWSLTNQDSDIPALSRRNENGELRMSTYFIEDGSYMKLRTAELGYTVPKNIANRIYMQRMRLYVSGHNLFTLKSKDFTGPDPENPGFSYRIPLTMTFGVNLTF
ncbi:TonB-dependent receptor [Parabacteroides sp. Marseille-P3160]|uniref:SusC/RagA family TonB-linked outer membrane protein n=1 Tax=Parabacteroides sp. Marseille-P3160 TaxID=1917887 RepID=UPI0009BBB769|nr:TonB-dependent receptor [Parabacteroides sp. Marseille-P3160]